jgi:hypothetical protein
MNEPSGNPAPPGAAPPREDGAPWPYASLFFFGFFGTDSPAGKRLAWRTTWGLGLFLLGAFLLAPQHTVTSVGGFLAMPGGVLLIGRAYRSYLRELDELSRTIQLEAFSLAFGAAMTLMAILMAVEMVAPPGTHLGPGTAPLATWLLLAEPFRGLALVIVARRYR